MKAVIQRVKRASVSVAGEMVSSISSGLLVLLGVAPDDTDDECLKLAKKICALRIFDDTSGVMNLSVKDIDGDVMAVSQFTLMASTRKGHRPSYVGAARGDVAEPLYENFCRCVEQEMNREVKMGVFGADMQVELVNDGPVTIIIDTANP